MKSRLLKDIWLDLMIVAAPGDCGYKRSGYQYLDNDGAIFPRSHRSLRGLGCYGLHFNQSGRPDHFLRSNDLAKGGMR